MKTKEEIETRIAELKAQEIDLEPWLQQARGRYMVDKKMYGNEADPTEVDHVLRLRKDLEVEYTALEWVLTESTQK